MRLGKFILGVVLGTLVIGLTPQGVRGADVPIFPTGPNFKIQPTLAWGTSVQPGFNNNYFFTPLNTNESVCVFVYNNNPTNAHPFTATIQVTGDPASIGPSTGTWQNAASSSGLNAPVSPGLPAGIGASVTGASQVSVNFSASTALGGAPDTASVIVIQTPGNCFSGNQFIGSAPQSISAVPQIQSISDGLSQAYVASTITTNPANNQDLIFVGANNGARTLYYDRLVIATSSATAIQVQLVFTNTNGATCSNPVVTNTKIGSTNASTAIGEFACVTHPAQVGGTSAPVFLVGSNSPLTIDLRGLIATSGSLFGIDITVQSGAVTGNVTTTAFWFEK